LALVRVTGRQLVLAVDACEACWTQACVGGVVVVVEAEAAVEALVVEVAADKVGLAEAEAVDD